MEKHFIRKEYYSSMDWHDWRAYTEFLGKPENAYAVEKDDFLDLCLKDIQDNHYELKDLADISEIKEKLQNEQVNERKFVYENEEECFYVAIYFESDSGLVLDTDERGFGLKIHYDMLSYEEKDIVYLPIEQFICCPKWSPDAQRCYSKYFTDFDLAYDFYEKMTVGDNIEPFLDYSKTILIGTREHFDNGGWYQKNQKVLSLAPFPKNSDSWHPLVTVQLEILEQI